MDSFEKSLDQTQNDLGIDPVHFVPVTYVKEAEWMYATYTGSFNDSQTGELNLYFCDSSSGDLVLYIKFTDIVLITDSNFKRDDCRIMQIKRDSGVVNLALRV